jgi:hypothetical protein
MLPTHAVVSASVSLPDYLPDNLSRRDNRGMIMRSARPVLPMTGGCSCGAIRYEITSFPLLLYACNCTNCQPASGSAFALNMPVATRGFRITQGEPRGWHHKSPSGADVTSWFCGECGARIYGDRKSRPESINVRAGTLDDTGWLVPAGHIFMKSALVWVQPAAGAECYEKQPEDFRPLAEKWRAMWPDFFPRE